ncbi:carcinoembryonic antigen-related cell adhesion molecule 1, partial [Biomphalaria glabrata]
KIDTPTISAGCSRHYGENGDFTLGCYTDSETIGMTYEWTVKGVVSSVTTKFYSLKAITSANNGDYICKAKFGSATSDLSPAETVTVTKPGLLCYHDNVCIAAKTGYSGKCDVNDRCTCSDGYSQKGEVCSNGVVQVVSSLAIILLTLVITKFL